MPATPQDIEELKARGLNPDDYTFVEPDTTQSKLGAVAAITKGQAGGTLGGGAGALGATALLAPWLAGPEAGIPADIAMIVGGAAGALGGGAAGQKIQQELQSPETNEAQALEMEKAQEQHPLLSAGTSIAEGALASGGSFSPSTTLKGLRGLISQTPEDLQALKGVALQSAINPAISAGTSLASTGTIPSTQDLLTQAVGGALFSQPSWLGEAAMRTGGEPTAKQNPPPANDENLPTKEQATTIQSPYTDVDPITNQPKISDNIIKKAYLEKYAITKDEMSKMDEAEKYVAQTKNDNMRKFMPIEDMRQQLHQEYMDGIAREKQMSTAEDISGKEPLTNKFESGLGQDMDQGDQTGKTPVDRLLSGDIQRYDDFKLAKAELAEQEGKTDSHPGSVAQKPPGEGEENVTPSREEVRQQKPITPNQARIINPATLLPSMVARPEVRPATPPAPVASELTKIPDPDPQDLGKRERINQLVQSGMTRDQAVQHVKDETTKVGEIVGNLPTGTRIRSKDGMLFENVAMEGDPADWHEIEENGDWVPGSVRGSENLRGGTVERHGQGKPETATPTNVSHAAQEPTQKFQSIQPALRAPNGDIVTSDKNHADAIHKAIIGSEGKFDALGAEKGFLIDGIFHNRKSAAEKTGIPTNLIPGLLHSEDVEQAGMLPGQSGSYKSQTQWPEKDFMTNAEKFTVMNPQLFEKGDKQQLLGTLRNILGENSSEWKIWKDLGIEKAYIPSGKALKKWIEDNAPQAKVVSYGMEGKVSEAKKEYDKMTHEWYDADPLNAYIADRLYDNQTVEYIRRRAKENVPHVNEALLTDENIAKGKRHAQLLKQIENEPSDVNPRATSAYSHVSALPTNEPMPDWTTTKSGKNVQRVDVVVPYDKSIGGAHGISGDERAGIKWSPDNLHENLPNTLGWATIQYKTGPKGEKIAVIAEAQSRWGQEMRNAKTYYGVRETGNGSWEVYDTKTKKGISEDVTKQEAEQMKASMEKEDLRKAGVQDHPLLRDYNRLILKAAIAQARKEGATHIMVSDAETAMMTEGHDVRSERIQEVPVDKIKEWGHTETGMKVPFGDDWKQGKYVGFDNVLYRIDKIENNRPEKQQLAQELKDYVRTGQTGKPAQEPGMRLNYDTVLPKIAEELTGSKGEKVSLGEHKNAYVPSEYPDGQRLRQANAGQLRSNLIFRNADGTPKTDVSGRMYPLGKAGERLTTGEPFSLTGSKYAEPSKWIQKNEMAPEELTNHIISGKATTGSVMAKIAGMDLPESPLAKELYGMMDHQSRNVPWQATMIKYAEYHQGEDKVNMGILATHHMPTIMEEAIHSMTSNKLPFEWEGLSGSHLLKAMTDYLSQGKNESIKELIKSYIQTAQHLGVHQKLFSDTGVAGSDAKPAASSLDIGQEAGYAMGNLHEFIAGAFKNTKFQHLLNEIPGGKGSGTMWQRVVNAVRSLLGININHTSMLDRVLRHSSALIAQERPSNAIQESSTGRLLPHSQEETGSDGSERGRMGQSHEGQDITKTGGKEEGEVKDRYMGRLGRMTRALADKVKDIHHAGARELGDALKSTRNDIDHLIGKYKNPAVEAGKGLTPRDMETINRVMDAERSTGKLHPEMLSLASSKAKAFYQEAHRLIDQSGKEAIDRKIPVMQNGAPRLMRQDPSHWPMMANQKVEQTYRENTDKASINALDQKFMEWNQKALGMSKAESQQRIDNWKQAIQGTTRSNDLSHQDYFNALRKAQGDPLPPEFRETNPVKNLSRYFDRYATAAAHFTHIENNPRVQQTLGSTKTPWGYGISPHPEGGLANNPTVRTALDTFTKEAAGPAEHNEATISSLITSAFIAGPPLEVHKVVSNLVKALSFAENPYQAVRAAGYALSHIKEGYIHAKEGGVVKLTASSLKDMFSGTTTSAEKMVAMAKAIRTVATLNDLTTNFNAGFQQSFFDFLIPSKLSRAAGGDVEAQQFLKNLDPQYVRGKVYDEAGQQELASIAARYVHGTGDMRSLPGWMSKDSEVSGFFQLAHWSVAQTNNFMKDVYSPATRGHYGPLIMSIFGSVAGGYLIKELRAELQGKKSSIPSLTEIAGSSRGLSGNTGLLAYNAIAAMQYSGFGGLLSQLAKYPFDFVYKNIPQGATFPLDEVAGDLVSTLKGVSTAIANDPHLNWVDMAQAVTSHVLTSNVQLSRMAINQGINAGLITGLPAEKKVLADKLNQLRRFDMTENLPYNELDESSNPYMNIEQRKFKMEQDPVKAVQQLPGLINTIIHRYGDSPDVMMQKIKSLKQNQYSTFPSMEDTPLSFMKYISYLKKTEGPEQAQAELMDYMKHKIINQAKSSVVPGSFY